MHVQLNIDPKIAVLLLLLSQDREEVDLSLQHDLDELGKLAKEWKMPFHCDK